MTIGRFLNASMAMFLALAVLSVPYSAVAPLYGRVVPLEMNMKTTIKQPRIPYRSLDEIRTALRTKGSIRM